MAERRMFAKTIIDSDAFLDMPQSSQLLYFHLSMRADDEGFINNPKSIMRNVGCKDDDLRVLISKKFIIPFESGIVVIKHWKIHNYIAKDRFKETKYKEERDRLSLDENNSYTECIQDVYKLDTQVRLGKDRLGEDSIGKDNIIDSDESPQPKKKKKDNIELFLSLRVDYSFNEWVVTKILEWLEYKNERKDYYVERGMKTLLTQIQSNVTAYGEDAIIQVIDDSMSNGYKGIIFDKLKKAKPQPQKSSYQEQVNNRMSVVDNW